MPPPGRAPGTYAMKKSLQEQLNIDLAAIDAALREVVESDPDLPQPSLVFDSIQNLIAAGGKRLRPMLAIVGSRFGKPDCQEAVRRAGALLEYMHMASLVHDDIIDRSDLRRGKPTLHTVTGVHTAVHVANYMMARAIEWAAQEGEQAAEEHEADEDEVARRSAQTASLATDLCLGEYDQLQNRFNFDLSIDQYLDKTRRKTALLMAECLKVGASAAEADAAVCELLYRFGEAIGMAFQIRDDILDFSSSPSTIGKPTGADLRNGNVTLPVLLALHDPHAAPVLRSLHAGSTAAEMDESIRLIQQSGAIEQALGMASAYGTEARHIIAQLDHYEASKDLRTLATAFTGTTA